MTELSVVVVPSQKSKRVVVIAHRVKAKMRDGQMIEVVPTKVAIYEGGKSRFFELATERDELDFAFGKFPTKWQGVDEAYEITLASIPKLPHHHIQWKKQAPDADLSGIPPAFIHTEKDGKKEALYLAHKFAVTFEGIRENDTVLMVLGGSGDPLAHSLSFHGEAKSANVYRLPGHALRKFRGEKPADQEARDTSELETIFEVWNSSPALFHLCDKADRERILVASCYQHFKESQMTRMGCAARLRQQTIGRTFMSEDGGYPEGQIEDWFARKKGNNELLKVLATIEGKAKLDLEKAVHASRVWQIFAPIVGVGPSIAGGIISAIGDIRRFEHHSNLIAFCGLHSLAPDGKKWVKGQKPVDAIMARQRRGQVSNWNGHVRQSLFLLGDQFNRRPTSFWGNKLLENKKVLRERHPDVVTNENGKKRYTDGHIHKLATWMTLRQFLKFLRRAWLALEKENMPVSGTNPDDGTDELAA